MCGCPCFITTLPRILLMPLVPSFPALSVCAAADASGLLTKIAKETSLRYAMHMIMCAALVAKQRRAAEVRALSDLSPVGW